MTPLEELRRLAPPPAVPVPAIAVDPPVPADYPPLLETHGMGEFCDLIFLGSGPEDVMDYERETRSEDPEDYPYPLHPEPGGLLPWGGTSNGQPLCWVTAGEPATWSVVVWDLKGRCCGARPAASTSSRPASGA